MNLATVAAEQRRYIQRVFSWMFAGLLMTALVAYLLSGNENVLAYFSAHPYAFFIILIAELILVFYLSARVQKLSATSAMLLFFIYAALNGITFSLLFALYTSTSIVLTFLVTAGMFGALALYGYVTKRDLSRMGSILFMALIGLILATLVNFFLQSSSLYWITTYAGVVIFSGLTAYDMQKIKETNIIGNEDTEEETKEAIIGALILYLDFLNLFLYLLRIFGNRD
ncbi:MULTISPECIES: Bax inhibitor-1 family protein [Aneurinibacillus]|uniref:Modulator of FtsH protease n=2 Tax=Aneurinibacillus thermoaerophilus TaxID=143495 RepID=A0A1G8A722_ANETH|nr:MULTISPECIES: Bax inhibitor-1/YccA family protein [Aneurinibacillus]MED0675450.1 Bax inhibitor-1/YccA family protein [Aneurinibacillus thermoaerophilus]MED0678805.1 Bax inhibitor-1/YccA family protein [Aneurinibacillus thermoaerophilus]MED0736678.1 Bax inhibitor-1/YccA family protein [Aneurinibacillus thermoaerophilus]MED0758333.1 Bax inhibitor-1/YccA family protein [Aneurinibacillus thermoaerophilus]MED0759860.1 Bax inhibitor-1/YccA family protein [Aneurinibacillus thermoaerophilus]